MQFEFLNFSFIILITKELEQLKLVSFFLLFSSDFFVVRFKPPSPTSSAELSWRDFLAGIGLVSFYSYNVLTYDNSNEKSKTGRSSVSLGIDFFIEVQMIRWYY